MLSRRGLFGWAAGAAAVAIGGVKPVAADVPILLSSYMDPEVVRVLLWTNDHGYQMATDLPIAKIGDRLPANRPASKKLKRACEKDPPKNETQQQFVKRMMLPCPGRIE